MDVDAGPTASLFFKFKLGLLMVRGTKWREIF
jgi:hypothetical protein